MNFRYQELIAAALLAMVSGCTSPRLAVYETIGSSADRDPSQARAFNEQGLHLAKAGQADQAAQAFREALRFEPAYAAAHNNLGLVLMQQGQAYEAALEFAFAARSAPQAFEPRLNLGRLYESVGWHKDAIDQYEQVLAQAPEHSEAMGRLVQVYRRLRAPSDRIEKLLGALVNTGDPRWSTWALTQRPQP